MGLVDYLLSYINSPGQQLLSVAVSWRSTFVNKKFVRETVPEAMISHTLSTQRRFCNVSPDFCHLS